MPATLALFNPYDPTCVVNACLNQVVGLLDSNPVAQYASCTSLYGSPVPSTVTPSAEVAFSTITSTLSYTDIVVEVTTTQSTPRETSTSYAALFQTTTAFTTTVVSTLVETARATATRGAVVQKREANHHRRKKKRGSCKAPSSSPAPPEPPAASSSSLVLSSPSASPSSSSFSSVITASESSLVSSPSSSASPLPPCTDSAQYLSACSCINAVSIVSLTALPTSTTTSTIHETISTTSFSTSTSTVTVVTTTIVVDPVTTTHPVTLSTVTATTTTTTSTSTSYILPPTMTASLVIGPGSSSLSGTNLVGTGSPMTLQASTSASAGTSLSITPAGGQIRLASNINLRMYLQNNSSVRNAIIFVTAGTASAAGHWATSCSVDGSTGVMSCAAPGRGWSRVITCGGVMYMTSPTYVNAACEDISLKVSPWMS